ncbi:patatin-like phospholipase family protein [Membranicola marinus]|uniref:Patatin-like phospholipase family protein n=1 Tax=Membranihabitans marinus TaxID=1227546 RepID=A0A953HWR8_9BACT|nr:cyclic nucleotide-binding and patatin-like phospholipase domain-containing protein [Membranihabitans marinus]MBY5957182.1 patatin-like phospholipase family protein [Membranihabitans marinus]
MDHYTQIPPITSDQDYVRSIVTKIFGELSDSQFDALFPLFDWIQIKAGQQLIFQDEESNEIFFLVYGRLTAIYEKTLGDSVILGDIHPGQAVGESGVIAEQPRTAHVFAARDSILIRLSKDMLYTLGHKYPSLILNLSKTIIRRTQQNTRSRDIRQPKSLVFVANNKSALTAKFMRELLAQLNQYGQIRFFDQKTILQNMGIATDKRSSIKAGNTMNIRMQKILDEVESSSDFVVYFATEDEHFWMNKVIAQADVFYILKEFSEPEELTTTEITLFSDHLKYKLTKKNLILLHPDGNKLPHNTARFLKNRNLELHHHIRMDRTSDIARLGRFITGNAIGIAFAGGGAKGLAHVGIMLSLREKGIPIDFFSGTSIGTFVTAFGALDIPSSSLLDKCRKLAEKAPTKRKNMNLAPLISLIKGKHIDQFIDEAYAGFNVEDAWINSAYVACDLTQKKKVTIRSGPMNEAIRASISLPGIFPPAVRGNSLYVDGGLLENLPIESLLDFPLGKAIAVTLHSTKKYHLGYDVVPGPWEYLKDRLLGKRSLKVPTITTIIMESMVLASYTKYEKATEIANLHLHPPVGKIGMLDWKHFDEMVEIGKEYTDQKLTPEVKEQLLPKVINT